MISLFKRKNKIKVFFICQWRQGYIKFYDVVKSMASDDKFDVNLLVVPENIEEYPKNKDLKYWEEVFEGINVINSITDKGWYSLKNEKPNYVFVQRPYNNYLPIEYATHEMCKYTKLCYIPYGYLLGDLRNVTVPGDFLKTLYFFFAENEYEQKYGEEMMKDFEGIHYSMNLGYPMLDRELKKIKEDHSAFLNAKIKDEFKIIYTPRWTMDKSLYSSTFFEYKDKFIDYVNKNNKIKYVFRPHPLMFNNFINEGLMSKKQVNEYLENFKENKVYDDQGDYFDTFRESDVLITDFSSIIIDYFILEKPIILCGNNDYNSFSEIMKKMVDTMYIANNWTEVEKYLNDLQQGKDPKKKDRNKILKMILEENDGRVSKKITECLKEDFYK